MDHRGEIVAAGSRGAAQLGVDDADPFGHRLLDRLVTHPLAPAGEDRPAQQLLQPVGAGSAALGPDQQGDPGGGGNSTVASPAAPAPRKPVPAGHETWASARWPADGGRSCHPMTIPYRREREQIWSCPYRQHHTASRQQLSRQTLTERDGDAGAPGSAVALTRQCYRSLRSASTERGRRACTSRTTASRSAARRRRAWSRRWRRGKGASATIAVTTPNTIAQPPPSPATTNHSVPRITNLVTASAPTVA